jgi:hypothetical protein
MQVEGTRPLYFAHAVIAEVLDIPASALRLGVD